VIDLVDSPDLCGAFCVWMSKQPAEMAWLTGRFVSANWYVEAFMQRKEEIIEGDLLKWRILLG